MQLGIPVPNISRPASRESIRTIAETADENGFHSVWLGDHIVWPLDPADQRPNETADVAKYGGDLFEPFVTAGYVAAATARVRIGFSIIVAAYRNPLITAKMLATLDQLSLGRVILGVGPGYVTGEFRALGIRRSGTGEKVDDLIGVIRAVCESNEPRYQGRHVSVSDVIFRPQPMQAHLPIWIGGNSEAAIRRAVASGDGWQPAGLSIDELAGPLERLRQLATEAGRDPATLQISNRIRVRIADRVVPFRPEAGDGKRYAELPAHIEGPPEYILSELVRFEEELGVSHLVLNLHESRPLGEIVSAMQCLGREVIPRLPPGPTIDNPR